MGKKEAGPEEGKRDCSINNINSVFGEDFFKMLLMSANVWVSFLDPGTRVKIWNSAAERMSGYSAEEVMDSSEIWKKLYPDPDYRKGITEKIHKLLSETESLDKFESRILRKDGETRIISWNTKEIRNDERMRGVFHHRPGYHRDCPCRDRSQRPPDECERVDNVSGQARQYQDMEPFRRRDLRV